MEENNTQIPIPPGLVGIVNSLKWGIENNTPLKEIPMDKNWCKSGYKCYYGGTIPGTFNPQEFAAYFVTASVSKVNIPENKNKPIMTSLPTDSFFIINLDIRNKDNIKINFFFYDGIATLKTIKRNKISIKQFTMDNLDELRKPWGKIDKLCMGNIEDELIEMFKSFVEKVESQKKPNESQHKHEIDCQCCEEHDASSPAGDN